jgi:hypothetical protein
MKTMFGGARDDVGWDDAVDAQVAISSARTRDEIFKGKAPWFAVDACVLSIAVDSGDIIPNEWVACRFLGTSPEPRPDPDGRTLGALMLCYVFPRVTAKEAEAISLLHYWHDARSRKA